MEWCKGGAHHWGGGIRVAAVQAGVVGWPFVDNRHLHQAMCIFMKELCY